MCVNLYLESMPEYCDMLEKGISGKNLDEIKYAAHASKPLFSTLGLNDLYKLADTIETDIRTNQPIPDITPKATELLNSMNKTLSDLKS